MRCVLGLRTGCVKYFNAATPKVEGNDHSSKLMLNYMFCIIEFWALEDYELTLIQNNLAEVSLYTIVLEDYELTLIQNSRSTEELSRWF